MAAPITSTNRGLGVGDAQGEDAEMQGAGEGKNWTVGGSDIGSIASSLPELTTWAERYGVGYGPGSGFTPIFTHFPRHSRDLTSEELGELKKIEAIEAYQRRYLNSFTTRELVELDIISTRPLKAPNLTNGIIPILDLDMWEKDVHPRFHRESLYPMDDGHGGDWVASNPVVAKVLEPVLQLLSRILLNIQMVPWFDALTLGEKRFIADNRIPPGARIRDEIPKRGLVSFHRRPGLMTPERQQQGEVARDNLFATLINRCQFRLGFGTKGLRPNNDEPAPPWHGVTLHFNEGEDRFISVWLSTNDMKGLLDPTITDTERLGLQWFLANTLIHELMHASWGAIWATHEILHSQCTEEDPYFEDEPIAEAGFSMEQAVFGGTSSPMPMAFTGTPFGYWLENWPSIECIQLCDSDVLTDPPLPAIREAFPLRASVYENLHQEEFWDIGVRRFGFQLFHDHNLRVGVRQQLGFEFMPGERQPEIDDSAPLERIFNLPNSTSEPSQADLLRMTPLQREADAFGRRVLHSFAIEQTFLKHSATVTGTMKHLMTEAVKQGQYGNVMAQQKAYISAALRSHGMAAKSLADLEKANAEQYPDRRNNLVQWDKGMRAYLNELNNIMKTKSPQGSSEMPLREELMTLERCRMMLVSPFGSNIPMEGLEDERILPAYRAHLSKNKDLCLQLCLDITGEPSCTVLDGCCARFLAAAADSSRPPEDRKQDVIREIVDIRRLKNPHPELMLPAGWTVILDRWARTAENMLQSIGE